MAFISGSSFALPKAMRTLHARIGMAAGGVVIAVALLLAGALSVHVRQEFLVFAGENLESAARQMGRELSSEMQQFASEIELQASRKVFSDSTSSLVTMRQALDSIKQSFPNIAYLAVIDAESGIVLAATGGIFEGGSAKGRPVFEESKSRLFVGDVHYAVRLAELLPAPKGEPLRFLDVGAPIRDSAGVTRRVLAAHIGSEWAQSVRKQVLGPVEDHRGIEIVVIDSANKVVLAPEKALPVGANMEGVARVTGAANAAWADSDYLNVVADVPPAGAFPGFGWRIAARQPLSVVLSALSRLQAVLFVAAIVFGGLGVAVAWSLARRLTAPVREFAAAADRLSLGEHMPGTPDSGGLSEIDLARIAFSRLAQDALGETKSYQLKMEAAAQSLRESSDRFALLLNSSAEGIYGMAPSSDCIFLNDAGALMLGYDPAELIGRPIHDVIHHHRADGRPYPVSECKIAKAAREGNHIRVDDEVFWHKNGTPVPVAYSVNPMIVGDRNQGAVITFSDISERQRSELALRTSEEKVRLAAQAAQLGIWTWFAADDRVVWENDRIYEILGVHRDEEPVNAARFATELVHPEDAPRFEKALSHAVESRERFVFEGRFYRVADKSLRWIELTGLPQKAAGDRPERLLGTAADITDRKLREETIRIYSEEIAAADRRKTEFLATLAHELRNPLAPLRNGLHLLRARDGDKEQLDKIRAMMERQVNQLVRLVDDLLDIARVTSGKIELQKAPACLQDVIGLAIETSMPLIHSQKHELVVHLPGSPIMVEVDSTRIAQVVSNLLNNAAKYTSSGGRIVLTAAICAEGNATITVEDNGIGIPSEVLGSVFQMFSQVTSNLDRSQGGLGIGLALVHRLVELHGGTVDAESPGPGLGSKFTVTLPTGRCPGSGRGLIGQRDRVGASAV